MTVQQPRCHARSNSGCDAQVRLSALLPIVAKVPAPSALLPTLSALRYLIAVAHSWSAAVDSTLAPSGPRSNSAAAESAAIAGSCGGSGGGGR